MTLPGSIFPHFEVNTRMPEPKPCPDLATRCTAIADQVVPEFRGKGLSCTGLAGKRWQAAWDGACLALGGDPAAFLDPVGE